MNFKHFVMEAKKRFAGEYPASSCYDGGGPLFKKISSGRSTCSNCGVKILKNVKIVGGYLPQIISMYICPHCVLDLNNVDPLSAPSEPIIPINWMNFSMVKVGNRSVYCEVEAAKSNQSVCSFCRHYIEKGERRIKFENPTWNKYYLCGDCLVDLVPYATEGVKELGSVYTKVWIYGKQSLKNSNQNVSIEDIIMVDEIKSLFDEKTVAELTTKLAIKLF